MQQSPGHKHPAHVPQSVSLSPSKEIKLNKSKASRK